MGANSDALVGQYVENAIVAEKSFEARLRGFAKHGDDDEVQAAFATHAEQIRRQADLLNSRLRELGHTPSESDSALVHAAEAGAEFAQSNVVEERIAQNLITAYTIGAAECAMYRGTATVARPPATR